MGVIARIKKSLDGYFERTTKLRARHYRYLTVTNHNISFYEWLHMKVCEIDDVHIRVLEFDIFPDGIETLIISHSIVVEMDINIELPHLSIFIATGTRTRDVRGLINLPRLNSITLLGCPLRQFDDKSLPVNIEHVNYKLVGEGSELMWNSMPEINECEFGLRMVITKNKVRSEIIRPPAFLKTTLSRGCIDLTIDGIRKYPKTTPASSLHLVKDSSSPY